MNIGLIMPGFSTSEEDWCIPAVLNLVRELARDNEVHVFALRYPHHRRTYPVYGATVHTFGGAATGGVGRISLLGRALMSVVRHNRHRPFDVLHGLWADEPGFLAVIASRWLGISAVVSLLGGELVGLPDIGYGGQLSRINRWLIRIALRGATRVTAGSASLRRLVQPLVSSDRLLLMPLGVDTRLFHSGDRPANPTPLAEGEIKLLHVASLVPVKDQATLLRALSRIVVRMPGVHLHVVGEGPLRLDLESLAESLGVATHVTFHGTVRHDCLPAYYRAADLCVLSSRYESQGMVILEAAACACPTVGTAVGLLPDLMPATQMVPVGDAYALAEVLLRTLADRQALIAMGQASLEAVKAGYTLDQTMDELSALYAELAGS
jgi:glycosyltransferase involved in cell wall biosynthesis